MSRKAFTILEALVACALFISIMVVLLGVISYASSTWQSASRKIDAFQNARSAFDAMTRQLGQATLNTYWDYDDPNDPTRYLRKSELHFVAGPSLLNTASHAVFFQAPSIRTAQMDDFAGMTGLLGGMGFFVDYGPDQIPDPFVGKVNPSHAFRLMQWNQNVEDLAVYDKALPRDAWYQSARTGAFPIADHVIGLFFRPKCPAGSLPPAGWTDSYEYDSALGGTSQPIKQHQLPPLVEVVMVAMDSQSAVRLGSALKETVESAMDGLFTADRTPETTLDADLSELGKRLTESKIDYRIFRTTIPLREGKWSKK